MLRAPWLNLASFACATLLLGAACSDGGVATGRDTGDDTGDETPGVDALSDFGRIDATDDDDSADSGDANDDASTDAVLDAANDTDGGDGSTLPGPADGLGDACDSNAECPEEICLEIGDNVRVCTRRCFGDEMCPTDWECVLDESTGGDEQRICQPRGECIDRDRDDVGIGRGCGLIDCNDDDPTINPRRDEICDGIDNDCDERIDDNPLQVGTACTGDFPGLCAAGLWICEDGLLVCETALPTVEVCDALDNDCDGLLDNDAQDAPLWYADVDGDGFGDPLVTLASCTAPIGYVSNSRDCAPDDAAINPAAEEIPGDEIDQNCDGRELCFLDGDSDGFTAPDPLVVLSNDVDCDDPGEAPLGTPATDCADSNPAVRPGAVEICNGIDDNCNGEIDTDAVAPITLYQDADGDGFGNALITMQGCVPGVGWSRIPGDCDDSRATVSPVAPEICDDLDNNCDGDIDEPSAIGATLWYRDSDRDGFGAAGTAIRACRRPSGHVDNDSDCDDGSSSIYPGAVEVCNGVDDNCDGRGELDAIDARTFYADTDGDGFGSATASVRACTAPTGYVANNTDCNDGAASAYPGGIEVCDGLDNNCNGNVDEDGAAGAPIWYRDADGDGYGDPLISRRACRPGPGWVENDDDCDDSTNRASPVGIEVCDGLDNDCDGFTDDGAALDAITYYFDGDGDGWGNSARAVEACSRPADHALVGGDCADTNAAINPGAIEVCDGFDNDCVNGADGADAVNAATWYRDVDGDGYGSNSVTIRSCTLVGGYTSRGNDCNDGNDRVSPGATEVCDGIDNNCNGLSDEAGATGERTWYRDLDGDGWGNVLVTRLACTRPDGWAELSGDCDDANPAVFPGAPELCNTVDDNCSGETDEPAAIDAAVYYPDNDGDGWGAGVPIRSCTAPPGSYSPRDGDCNDSNPQVYPTAPEYCDELDRDCDGIASPPTSVDALRWYRDLDGDGYGSAAIASEVACTPTPGFVINGGDCDEARGDVNPGAPEVCDGIDNNCVDGIDEGCF